MVVLCLEKECVIGMVTIGFRTDVHRQIPEHAFVDRSVSDTCLEI